MWGNRLDAVSWRIDVKAKARQLDQLGQPTAIMEMKIKSEMENKVVEGGPSGHYHPSRMYIGFCNCHQNFIS